MQLGPAARHGTPVWHCESQLESTQMHYLPGGTWCWTWCRSLPSSLKRRPRGWAVCELGNPQEQLFHFQQVFIILTSSADSMLTSCWVHQVITKQETDTAQSNCWGCNLCPTYSLLFKHKLQQPRLILRKMTIRPIHWNLVTNHLVIYLCKLVKQARAKIQQQSCPSTALQLTSSSLTQ